MENKIQNIADFYAITHKLKTTLRAGWQVWEVDAKRFESVAEHIYGTQMLAFAVNSEFSLGLDIVKVCYMLAMHELGETIIGDIPYTYIVQKKMTKEHKHKIEKEAVEKILAPLNDRSNLSKIYDEYEEGKTKEAIFAKRIDKLEALFQCKYYEENGCNDYETPKKDKMAEAIRLDRRAKGWNTLVKAWVEHDKKECNFDEAFCSISDYLLVNNVFQENN